MHDGSAWLGGYVRVHEIRGLTVIEFHGEIDIATALHVLPTLDAATVTAGRTVVLDLGPVGFFDIYALRLLCRVQDRVVALGGRLILVCDHGNILKLLRAGGLMERFAPVPSVQDALDRGGQEAAG
ncbi:STAS domain-containing protein [Streptomyces sp. VRA16 Mangrove soil]|uniref:STAS domain-containing protein n=1 Tax=Streptomyces sp. VRA16 Mangrove soil TaxID=2817434 RepID=UPI001A9DA561|nr:STAS domain-containing protein [Streptomyces sp. VRA16 Mangrove soil]MBO1332149.1 STAS domain-containing protein [Streptomyces sp. VRA16 Mangrove soil]